MRQLHEALGGASELLDFWDEPVAGQLDVILARLAACELLVGERLHAMVLAAAVGVPFVGVAYKPKCHDFGETLGLSHLLLDPGTLTPDGLTHQISAVLNGRAAVEQQMGAAVADLRGRLRAAADEIRFLASRTSPPTPEAGTCAAS
jgi:polysaccharide pyruvyl transferase WcaK-like protein